MPSVRPSIRRLAMLIGLALLGASVPLVGLATAPDVVLAAGRKEQPAEPRAVTTATTTPTPPRREAAEQRGTATKTPAAKPSRTAIPIPPPTMPPPPPTPSPTPETAPEAVAEEPVAEEVPGEIETTEEEDEIETTEEWIEEPIAVEPEPVPVTIARPHVVRPIAAGRTADGLSLHVLPYLPLILGAAEAVGVDPAVLAALMEVEGSGENAVSHAGAMGLMQLMPDKLVETDDPFDPGTNILRAAELVRRLTVAWDGDLAAVAGAYFGAVAADGTITDASDGIMDGIGYVTRFAEAYERWAVALDQPLQVVAIRPKIRQRPPPVEAPDPMTEGESPPDRDRWYLELTGPRPAILPIYF